MLEPWADQVRAFDLMAPQAEPALYLTVVWRDAQRPNTIVPVHDETSVDFESEILRLLAP
jgi:hypothetical protein